MRRIFNLATHHRTIPAWLSSIVVSLLLAANVFTQRLPLRHYDIADGLAHGTVTSVYQDRKGYIWFATFEGLSRFDGYRFVNYDPRDGFNHPIVNDVTEDRQGRLWIATNGGGIARLLDSPPERPNRAQTDAG